MVDHRRVRFTSHLRRGFATGPKSPPSQKPITLRARPLLFISSFVILHQALTTFSLLPAYGYFRLTDSSTSFLVGPYAAFILRLPVPLSRGERTVEDLVDGVLRRSVKTGWGLWSKWRRGKNDESEANEIAEEVIEGLEGKKRWRDKMTDRISVWKTERDRRTSRTESYGLPNASEAPVTRKNTMLKKIADAAAAYLLVKSIFPFRLVASVLLTPRLARAFGRRWG